MIAKTTFNMHPITPDVAHLFHIFDNQIRMVGGCVRDYVMQKEMHDYDFATPLSPEKVIEILKKNKIASYSTGLKHGTVTAVYHDIPYEITTLRTDTETDGRHAAVHFVTDYALDAKRRDFTMNALYMDAAGNISDYTSGLADIQARCVRFIGNPEHRVQEDYLRILRYFRFLSYFGTHQIDKSSLCACEKHRAGLKQISIERIREEIMRLLSMPFTIEALTLMKQSRVAEILLPVCYVDKLAKFISIYPQSDSLERLMILTNESKSLDWKWSNEQKKRIALYSKTVTLSNDDNANRYLLWQIGKQAFLFHVARAAAFQLLDKKRLIELQNLTVPVFPIVAADIIALGYKGAQIGQQLKIAEHLWAKIGLPCEKKLVIEYLLHYNRSSS